ncbi:MAG: hypothetical protein ACTSRS_07760 [Candidatus Helarchaeota archaeon]
MQGVRNGKLMRVTGWKAILHWGTMSGLQIDAVEPVTVHEQGKEERGSTSIVITRLSV